MAKKKKDDSWEKIGKMAGKKMEKEFKNKKNWQWCADMKCKHEHHAGGFGRLLFAIGILILLNRMGVLSGVPMWLQILIGAGFTFMRL